MHGSAAKTVKKDPAISGVPEQEVDTVSYLGPGQLAPLARKCSATVAAARVTSSGLS